MRSRSVWLKKRHYTTRYLAEILVVDVRVLPPLDNFSLCETGPGKDCLGKPTFRELRCFGFGKSLVTGLKHGEHGMEAYK